MFEQTFVQAQVQTRRPWTVVASLSAQCGVIAVVLLIPLLHPEKMRIPDPPKPRLISTWVTLPLTPQNVHAASQAASTPSPYRQPPGVFYPQAAHPVDTPQIGAIPDEASSSVWQIGPGPGFPAGVPIGSSLPAAATTKPPVPPAPTRPVSSGPVRITHIDPAELKFSPRPIYPQIAITTRTQGTVKLEAIIAADGRIKNLRVLSGSPLLVKAALDAVAQWKYQPTLLNGVAVEVLTEVSVNFTLAR